MRKWILRLTCSSLALIFVGFAILWLTAGKHQLTWEDYDRVEAGVGKMTEADVVRILGRPPDSEVDKDHASLRWWSSGHRCKIWKDGLGGYRGDGFEIEIIFDSKGVVAEVDFGGNATPDSMLSKIRRWFGL
jgi:hypothetical protein